MDTNAEMMFTIARENRYTQEKTSAGKKTRIRVTVLGAAAVLLLVLLFGSGNSSVIGTWKCVGGTGDYGTYCKGDTYTFNEDHTYQMTQAWGYKGHGTYEIEDGKIILTQSNGGVREWGSVKRVGDELQESHKDLNGYRIWKKK